MDSSVCDLVFCCVTRMTFHFRFDVLRAAPSVGGDGRQVGKIICQLIAEEVALIRVGPWFVGSLNGAARISAGQP